MNLFKDFIHLFFAHTCPVCGGEIISHRAWLCNSCLINMPLTGFWDQDQNPMEQKFWGLLPLRGACSLLHYSKASSYTNLIYDFKYYNHWRTAYNMGLYFGNILRHTAKYRDVDYIVPVPLHPLRKYKRGYNQSEYLAKGLAKAMDCTVSSNAIKRIIHTPTQTRKDKYERWENMENVFVAGDLCHFKGKHIMIVDDVLTTGSTIVSCAEALLRKQSDCTLSIVTLASRVDIPGKGAIDDDKTVVKI